MKRGKDEEKILEPMFPRLHVNDAEKGGPRAPPRNKMALYEQLSIPSQRFRDPGTLPLNSFTNTNTVVPPGPSNQPSGVERHLYAQRQMPSSATVHATEKFVSQRSFMDNVRSMAQHNEKKMIREEDDFAVPVFVNSRKSQFYGRIKSGTEKEKDSAFMAPISHRSVEIQEVTLSATKEMDVEKSTSRCDRVNECNASLRQDYQSRLDQNDSDSRVNDAVNGVESQLAMERHSDEGSGSPDDIGNGREHHRNREFISLQQGNDEASDGLSDETSMVDYISGIDLSPDDVVGVLGQKRFWRARKAIANQQRVFSVQLFELHRLIKVQKLIAASPNLLLDDVNYIAKAPAKKSPLKKILPVEFIVKPLPDAVRLRGDSEKTDQHRMECSAENVIWKHPTDPIVSPSKTNQVHHQPSNYMPFLGNGEAQMTSTGGWCFPPQPPLGNQQWLIPVMSPSEGLIYKPHSALGHTGPVCRGTYGQFMPAPMLVSNFMGGQGAPPPYHPGVGFPSPGHGYFPPYGMPTMNPHYSGQHQPNEQMNQFGHAGDLQSSALNIQQQSSCNTPRNSETAQQQQQHLQEIPPTKSCSRTRKSSQPQQGSNGSRVAAEGSSGNSFRPFPTVNEGNNNASKQTLTTTTTTTRTTVTQTTREGGATRVIKVVPHNAKVASENAARIFKSIQEERKQYDSFSNT